MLLPGIFAEVMAVSASRDLTVCLNDIPLEFDVPPHFQQDEPMVPLRRVCEELGFEVIWEVSSRRIVLKGLEQVITLYPGNPLYSINQVVHRASRPPFIVEGRTMAALDFLQNIGGVKELIWDQQNSIINITAEEIMGPGKPSEIPWDEQHQAQFIEVLLPPAGKLGVGEEFEFKIDAPLVKGIYAYEINFFYNPGIIRIKEINNPVFNQENEYYLKNIANADGTASYTLTALGFQENIAPRQTLAIFKAVVLRKGAIAFNEHTLKIRLLDNTASYIPVFVSDKTLYVEGD